MKNASEKIQEGDKTLDQKRVLYEILDARQKTVRDLSRSLTMREERIRNILGQLKKIIPSPEQKGPHVGKNPK